MPPSPCLAKYNFPISSLLLKTSSLGDEAKNVGVVPIHLKTENPQKTKKATILVVVLHFSHFEDWITNTIKTKSRKIRAKDKFRGS
ncbi:MAG: hypothetical protein B7Z16_12390 [Algoriphagus sp. 32-45-6]|nr:MAG: hypothetical protein B7Z16_12390 [Algoriphagus sp. 32-45-6]